MAKITWDATGSRKFETGIKNCVLYPMGANGYAKGVAWNGITAINETPSGAEATSLWADNIKYLNLISAEEFGGTIEAYMYPDEFAECNGEASILSAANATGVQIGQQARKLFGLCYRTEIGSDTAGNAAGYKLHLVYGCTASASERAYSTINDSPEAITFSWEFKTTPVAVSAIGTKTFTPTSILTIDSTKVDATKLAALEALLYGTDTEGSTQGTDPAFQLPDQVAAIFNAQ